jgi:hypothetical protein
MAYKILTLPEKWLLALGAIFDDVASPRPPCRLVVAFREDERGSPAGTGRQADRQTDRPSQRLEI